MKPMNTNPTVCLLATLLGLAFAVPRIDGAEGDAPPIRPRTIALSFAADPDSQGGLIAAELDGAGELEILVTAPGHIGAWRQDGGCLWRLETDIRVSAGSSESVGLPGHHAPGCTAADVDGDGALEVLFLDGASRVHILDGRTGKEERLLRFTPPRDTERWEHLAVLDLRGKGDRDLVLQATNRKGYRMGRFIAAYSLAGAEPDLLWETDRFGALAHGPFRAADLNGDGRDEICGTTILGPDGRPARWSYPPVSKENVGGASFHIDSIFIADVRPDIPGLEVVLLEEGRNYTAAVSYDRGVLWWTTNARQEPQNAAVGEFDPTRPGLEVWCRSRYDTHQKPWVLDARGKVIARYEMDRVAPPGWTQKGVEVIWTIDWTGEEVQLAAAKERHESGDVAVFEPMTGRFVLRIPERADRLYVADVSGDWREEMVVWSGKEIHIYGNPAPNPRPDRPRLWKRQDYRRSKVLWNYYSP
ncbi:MAG: hypothetical protein JXP34_16910 [Planctomycetes bacterium]|nr:hypothetical protein [Planctomycetota bacterium]